MIPGRKPNDSSGRIFDQPPISPYLIFGFTSVRKGLVYWTVNDPIAISYFIDLGVDNIITDVPDVVNAVMEERSSLSDVEKVLLIIGRWLKQ